MIVIVILPERDPTRMPDAMTRRDCDVPLALLFNVRAR